MIPCDAHKASSNFYKTIVSMFIILLADVSEGKGCVKTTDFLQDFAPSSKLKIPEIRTSMCHFIVKCLSFLSLNSHFLMLNHQLSIK